MTINWARRTTLTAQLPVPSPDGNPELLETPGRLVFTKGLTQLLNTNYC